MEQKNENKSGINSSIKKTSPLAVSALILGMITLLAAFAYLAFYDLYTDSLHTDKVSGYWMSMFGGIWFFSSAISIFLSFIAMLHVAFSKKYSCISG